MDTSAEAAALGNWVGREVLMGTSLGSLPAPVCSHTRGVVSCLRIQGGSAYETDRERERERELNGLKLKTV